MDIQPIDFNWTDEEAQTGTLDCPVCGAAWVTVTGGDAGVVSRTRCPHLKFVIEQSADDVEYFNDYSEEELLEAVSPILQRLDPDFDPEDPGEVFQQTWFNEDLWDKVSSPAVDTILDLTQEGMACGPVSHTVYFGAQLETPTGVRSKKGKQKRT